LRFARGKTRIVVEIEIVGELAKIIDECLAASVVRSTSCIAKTESVIRRTDSRRCSVAIASPPK